MIYSIGVKMISLIWPALERALIFNPLWLTYWTDSFKFLLSSPSMPAITGLLLLYCHVTSILDCKCKLFSPLKVQYNFPPLFLFYPKSAIFYIFLYAKSFYIYCYLLLLFIFSIFQLLVFVFYLHKVKCIFTKFY